MRASERRLRAIRARSGIRKSSMGPLAGMPAALKLNASVPSGENSSWFRPTESK